MTGPSAAAFFLPLALGFIVGCVAVWRTPRQWFEGRSPRARYAPLFCVPFASGLAGTYAVVVLTESLGASWALVLGVLASLVVALAVAALLRWLSAPSVPNPTVRFWAWVVLAFLGLVLCLEASRRGIPSGFETRWGFLREWFRG